MKPGEQDTNKKGGGAEGDQSASAGAATEAGGQSQATWYDSFPKEHHDVLKGYEKPELFLQDHLKLREATRTPEKPEDYKFDDVKLDDKVKEGITAFKAKAKEFGLTQKQFESLLGYELAAFQEQTAKAKKAQQDTVNAGIEELKKEWGNNFDANVKLAQKTMQSIFPSRFGKFLEDSGLGNHPEMVRAMVALSKAVSEDVIVKGTGKVKAPNRDPQTGEPMLKFTSMG